MFGKPEWFGKANIGIGYLPRTLTGCVYYLAWPIVVAAPIAGLVFLGKFYEAGIWGAIAFLSMIWDLRRTKRITKRHHELSSLFYIDDAEEHSANPVETQNYEFSIKEPAIQFKD